MSLLQLFRERGGASVTVLHDSAPQMLVAARRAHREAHNARSRAATELEAAADRVEKAHGVIAAAVAATAAYDAAEREAKDAAAVWTRSGCPEDQKPDPALLERAAAAHRAAVDAGTVAAGARAALPALEKAERDARSAFEVAAGEVRASGAAVIEATLTGSFERAARAAEALNAAADEILAASLALAWRPHEFSAPGRAGEILARLNAIVPRMPSDPAELLKNHRKVDSKSWEQFARRLLGDAEAQLDE